MKFTAIALLAAAVAARHTNHNWAPPFKNQSKLTDTYGTTKADREKTGKTTVMNYSSFEAACKTGPNASPININTKETDTAKYEIDYDM